MGLTTKQKYLDWLDDAANPHRMGFRIVDDPLHRKEGRSMWHQEGEGWSISVPIPGWQSSLMRFTQWSFMRGIDFPVNIRCRVANMKGRMKVCDHHELDAVVKVMREPLLIMAASTPVARRLRECLK